MYPNRFQVRSLLVVPLILILGASATVHGAQAPREGPPNILFILVDDLGKEWISCYGAEGIRTPNVDRLAATGMRFENAWCMPQCTPTRVTLLTGQYPYRHGWTNHLDVPRWGSGGHFDPTLNPSFPLLLREAGYANAIAGKWQIDDFRVESAALDEAGFDEWCVWTGGEAGNPPSDERYWDPYIRTGDESRTYPGRFGPDVYGDFLVDFLRRHRDRPFFAYFPMCLTHGPLVATPDEPDADSKDAKNKAMVRAMDTLIGRVVATLDDLGLRDNTIIVFTTDNGTGGGITGRRLGHDVRGAKAEMVEAGTAMPFIVNGPGRVPEGVVTDSLVDFTDILPTFAALAGTRPDPRYVVDGRSFAPLILGRTDDSPRDWILSMGGHPASFRDNRIVPSQVFDDRVIRDKRWKLWVGEDRRPSRLFDMDADPWESQNLIDSKDPEAVGARDRLWGIIAPMPVEDAIPRYRLNPPQPWDRYEYRPPTDVLSPSENSQPRKETR